MLVKVSGALALLLVVAATSCSNSLDPYPAAIFVVDTDVAVPRFVDRLRVDTFTVDGTWLDSHDYAILNARDWPVSFGVFSRNETAETRLVVRLRAYTGARVRDYRGERFADSTGVSPGPVPATAAQLPRLIVDGRDVTPTDEPEPTTAIERLVEVVLMPGQAGAINVVLRGDCMGTMARLSLTGSYAPLATGEATTCIDKANVRLPLTGSAIGEKSTARTIQGTWNPTTSCPATGAGATTTCVPGGAFFLGSPDSVGWDLPTLPQRVVALSPFRMDTNEVTVAKWRAALTAGLVPADETPWPYDLAFPTTPSPSFVGCTYSASPIGREQYPINCITFASARAYCKNAGGDLPTEAQWEYAATAAGRSSESRYPWAGQTYPDCTQSIHSRGSGALPGASACAGSGFGPQPVTTASGPGQDVTPLGIVNLAGSMSEWTLDTVSRYDDPCWLVSGLEDSRCIVDGRAHVARGSYWGSEQAALSDRLSSSNQGYYGASLGFRCVYPAAP